jgi:hypothetical protein
MIDGGSHVWAGEVFSSEVEGVEVSCGGRAEPGSGILLLALQAGGGLRGGVARQCLLEQLGSSPGVQAPGLDYCVWVPRTMFCAPGRTRTYDRQIRNSP